MRTFAPGTGGEMKAQSMQSRFIQMLEVELSFANNQLVEAREDIEFYRAKVERLELTRQDVVHLRRHRRYAERQMLLATAKLGKDERQYLGKGLQPSDSLEKLCSRATI